MVSFIIPYFFCTCHWSEQMWTSVLYGFWLMKLIFRINEIKTLFLQVAFTYVAVWSGKPTLQWLVYTVSLLSTCYSQFGKNIRSLTSFNDCLDLSVFSSLLIVPQMLFMNGTFILHRGRTETFRRPEEILGLLSEKSKIGIENRKKWNKFRYCFGIATEITCRGGVRINIWKVNIPQNYGGTKYGSCLLEKACLLVVFIFSASVVPFLPQGK